MKKILSFILLGLMCSIGNLWAETVTFSAEEMASQAKKSHAQAICATSATDQQIYKPGSAVKQKAISISSSADTAVIIPQSGKALQFKVDDGYVITGIDIKSVSNKDTLSGEVLVMWAGAIDHFPAYYGRIAFPGRAETTEPNPVSVANIPNGTTAFGLYRRIKVNSTTGEIGTGSNYAPSGQTFNVFSVSITYEATVTYTATYKANGSGESDVIDNNASEVAANPFTWAGHAFTGWNTAADGNGTPYAVGDALTGNVTLYAQWEAALAVNFDMQGHGDQVETQYILSGGKVAEPENPSADGYLFGGWYAESACETAWDFANNTITVATTIYAKWTDLTTISGEIIRATHTGAKTADVIGLIGGSVDKNTQSGGKVGGNDQYFGIKLAAGTFLPGDVVTIYATTPSSMVEIFGTKTFSSAADSVDYIDQGVFVGKYYTYVLTSATEWIYLYRTKTAGSAMNPTLGYISVSRNPSYSRDVTAGNYGTICLPNAVAAADFKGATLFNIAGKRTVAEVVTSIVLEEVEGDLIAGRPYIFEANLDKICAWYNGDAAAAGSHNGLVGTLTDISVDAPYYLLAENTIVNAVAGSSLPANRAYIDMAAVPEYAETPAPGRIIEIALGGNGATNINNLEGVEEAVKFMQDGKLYIMKNGVLYNAVGAVVK